MRELREALLSRAPGRFFLWVLSWAYLTALQVRRFWCDITGHTPKPSAQIACEAGYGGTVRVISVGNLTAGGAGKTSMSAYLAREILERTDQSVCLLSRGYKGADEPRMLAAELAHYGGRFAVEVGANRAGSARQYLKKVRDRGVTFILDDAHQHFSLAKDASLVLIDSLHPDALNDLLPLGFLREPMAWGLQRADAVVLTYSDLARPSNLEFLEAIIRRHRRDLPIFRAAHVPLKLSRLGAEDGASEVSLSWLAGKNLMLVSGIGNPGGFEETVSRKLSGRIVSHRVFEDHHVYRDSDWEKAVSVAETLGAEAVVTTAKDAVRLAGATSVGIPCLVLNIGIKISERESEFFSLLGLYEKVEA